MVHELFKFMAIHELALVHELSEFLAVHDQIKFMNKVRVHEQNTFINSWMFMKSH